MLTCLLALPYFLGLIIKSGSRSNADCGKALVIVPSQVDSSNSDDDIVLASE